MSQHHAAALAAVAALTVTVLTVAGCRDRPSPPPPGPAVVAAGAVLEPPLHDAAVGEELVLRRGEQEWLYRVAQAKDTEGVVEVVTYEAGIPQARPQLFRWHRNGFGMPDDVVVRGIEPTRLVVDGRSVACWLLRAYSPRGQFAYWIDPAAPVHGVLRMAAVEDGRPVESGALVRVR